MKETPFYNAKELVPDENFYRDYENSKSKYETNKFQIFKK